MTRTERNFYVVWAGYSFAQYFLSPVYVLFLLSRGCDLFQVNVVLAVFLLTTFMLEIPTGAIADHVGRKASFVLGCLVRTGAFALYAVAGSFADCLVAEVIDGVGFTLASGALDAWAVDGVRAEGDERATDRMFARAQVVTRVAMLGGGIASGHLGAWHMEACWVVAAAAFAVTALGGAVAMREPRLAHHAPHVSRPSFAANAALAVQTVRTNPVLRLLCILTAALGFASFPVWQTWQARLDDLTGAGPWLMGWVLALFQLVGLAGSAVLPRLLTRVGRVPVLCMAIAWRAVTLLLAARTARAAPVIAGLACGEATSGMTEPVLLGWTNEHVPAAQRATVLSIRSTCFTFGGAMGLVLLGLVSRTYGIPLVWSIAAVVLAATAVGSARLAGAGRLEVPGIALDVATPASKLAPPGA
jgi:MFS family permease